MSQLAGTPVLILKEGSTRERGRGAQHANITAARIVARGGAPEQEVARVLKEYADTLPGREQLAVQRYAEALEAVPTTLSENAGLDPIDIISELRARHEKGEVWAGVDVQEGKVKDMRELEVYEPLAVKKQIIKSATEAASMILRIDYVIAATKPKEEEKEKGEEEEKLGG